MLGIIAIIFLFLIVFIMMKQSFQPKYDEPEEIYEQIVECWKRQKGGRIKNNDFVIISMRYTDFKVGMSDSKLAIDCYPELFSQVLDCFEENEYQLKDAELTWGKGFFVTRVGPAV